MTPFQLLVWLTTNNAIFSSKNGEFSFSAKDLYISFKIPVEEQLSLSAEKLVEYITLGCLSIRRGLEGPEKQNGPESTDVS